MECQVETQTPRRLRRSEIEDALSKLRFQLQVASRRKGRYKTPRRARSVVEMERCILLQRSLWRGGVSSLRRSESEDALDCTPSLSYCKNAFVMGMFTSSELKAPHLPGIGTWRPQRAASSSFSTPPRLDWSRNWSVSEACRMSPERARLLKVLKDKIHTHEYYTSPVPRGNDHSKPELPIAKALPNFRM